MAHYGTIIIGGGTMGTAAAWELGKRGERTLVLEQFGHVHSQGSHGGLTRIIRHAYAEGADYVPLVRRADDLWLELERATGEILLHRVGGLEMAAPGFDHARRARQSAAAHNVPFEWMDAAEVRRRWPVFRIPDGWEAGFGPQSGFLSVEPALRALAHQARQLGVEIRDHVPVTKWGASASGAWVETDRERTTADRLIITAGAWAANLLAKLGSPLEVRRKVLFWLETTRPELFQPDQFPVFITDSDFGEIYGFPIFEQAGLKIAAHNGGQVTSAEQVDRTVDAGESRDVVRLAQAIFPGITGRVVSSAVCLYTMTPDTDFICDRHPEWPHVVYGAGFSGHGFKFATAIGEHLANLALVPAADPMPNFAAERLKRAVG
jgi:monomeric sarcosine oxidase